MGYPWYSHGTTAVGHNQLAALRTDKNCNTKQIRLRIDVISGGRKHSISGLTHKELVQKCSQWLVKNQGKVTNEVYADLQSMVEAAKEA